MHLSPAVWETSDSSGAGVTVTFDMGIEPKSSGREQQGLSIDKPSPAPDS